MKFEPTPQQVKVVLNQIQNQTKKWKYDHNLTMGLLRNFTIIGDKWWWWSRFPLFAILKQELLQNHTSSPFPIPWCEMSLVWLMRDSVDVADPLHPIRTMGVMGHIIVINRGFSLQCCLTSIEDEWQRERAKMNWNERRRTYPCTIFNFCRWSWL